MVSSIKISGDQSWFFLHSPTLDDESFMTHGKYFQKPYTFREIDIFICFGSVLLEGSMGVWLENANLLSAISVSGRLFARRGNFLKKRKGLTTYYALFGQLASRRVRRI